MVRVGSWHTSLLLLLNTLIVLVIIRSVVIAAIGLHDTALLCLFA